MPYPVLHYTPPAAMLSRKMQKENNAAEEEWCEQVYAHTCRNRRTMGLLHGELFPLGVVLDTKERG